METKGRVIQAICSALGIEPYEVGAGSSVPREFFSKVAESLGLSDEGTATDVARRIAKAGHVDWPASATSEFSPSGGGGTVTLQGLELLRAAVDRCLREDLPDVDSLPLTVPAVPGEWTLLEGQTTTRGILNRRYGIGVATDIEISPWTDDIFIFFDPSGRSVVRVPGDEQANKLVVQISLVDWHSVALGQELVSGPAFRSGGNRPVRVFEGVDSAAKYFGEYEFSSHETRWLDDSTLTIEFTKKFSSHREPAFEAREQSTQVLDADLPFMPYVTAEFTPNTQEGPLPFEVDPDLLDRALGEHSRTQNAVAEWLLGHGLQPLSPTAGAPAFDVAWIWDRSCFVAEVKSINEANEQKQFRLGLGQVLDYAQELDARPVLVLSAKPGNARLLTVAARAGVLVVWPDLFTDLDPTVV